MYKLTKLDKINISRLISFRWNWLSTDEIKEWIESVLSMDNETLANYIYKILHVWENDWGNEKSELEKDIFNYCKELTQRLIDDNLETNTKKDMFWKKIIPNDIVVSVENIKNIMEQNATWKEDISKLLQSYNSEYKKINTWCVENWLLHKNKFADLRGFYNYWRDNKNKLTSYASRRNYINSLYNDFSSWVIEMSWNDNTLKIIEIHPSILSHIEKFYISWHYATAVEEAYKITRKKLIELTWKEKAHEAFKDGNYNMIFWFLPKNEAEKNFCEWVKFLHLAIQNFRNEKAHTPAKELDKNKAIHYIYLASLALYLIDW